MARTANKDQPQKTITIPIEEALHPVSGLQNTILYEQSGVKYAGQPLINVFPFSSSSTDLVTGVTIPTYRVTGSGMWDLDSNKTLMLVKSHTSIYLYSFVSGVAPALISTITCSAGNSEVYLETVYGATEKAATTGFTKYVFLNLPGEAWIVAYNTRIGNWQVEKVNNTYSAWTSSSYAKGDRRIPTVDNGYYYEVTVAGTGMGIEPTWPTTIGDTVVDASVTWICRGRYNNFPTTTSSSVQILDGYIFVCVGKDIYNSDLDLPDSWTTSNFISTETNPDNLVALAKYKNYIVAFGTNTIEFFYDAANTNGSPLARQEGVQHNIGCIGQGAVTQLEDRIFWIARSGSNYYSIWELDNFKVKKVSSSEFDNLLTNNLINTTTLYPEVEQYQLLFLSRIAGKFVLGIPVSMKITSTPVHYDICYFIDLESNLVSTCSTIDNYLALSRPFTYKSFYFWTATSLAFPGNLYVTFTILTVAGYDSSFTYSASIYGNFVPYTSVQTKRLTFGINNYKVLNEVQVNVLPGTPSNSIYWTIQRDQEYTLTSFIPIGGYRTTRCGRAREFTCTFYASTGSTSGYPISLITFKYTEHNN